MPSKAKRTTHEPPPTISLIPPTPSTEHPPSSPSASFLKPSTSRAILADSMGDGVAIDEIHIEEEESDREEGPAGSARGGESEGGGTDDGEERGSDRGDGSHEKWERAFALFVACLLSVGSHYGSYLLGPLKTRIQRELGTSNAQFSLMLAAFSLNNSWTPLIGGIATAHLGTPLASIIATSLILLGQFIVMLSSGSSSLDGSIGSIRGMAFGLWVFGLGVSPLAVVQETIIVRYFSHHGLGVSLALGLVAGKGASFVSSITSLPIAEKFGSRAPFVVSTLLASMSFAVNVLYLIYHRRIHGTVTSDAATDNTQMTSDEIATQKVIERRKVRLMNLSKLGDVFWLYILTNVFSGAIWSPFLHLAANLIQRRYSLPDSRAASYASLLLAGSIFLYPLAGFIHDYAHRRIALSSASSSSTSPRRSPIVYQMLLVASVLTLSAFVWLVLPVEMTGTPVPAMMLFGVGHGFATLLLVLVVPGLVGPEWISTALGAHKSMEAASTTLSQTLSGLLLDTKHKIKGPSSESVLSQPILPHHSSLSNPYTNREPRPAPLISTFANSSPSTPHPSQDIPAATPATFYLLATFLFINLLQLISIIALWLLASRRPPPTTIPSSSYQPLHQKESHHHDHSDDDDDEDDEFDTSHNRSSRRSQPLRSTRHLSTSSRRPLLFSDPSRALMRSHRHLQPTSSLASPHPQSSNPSSNRSHHHHPSSPSAIPSPSPLPSPISSSDEEEEEDLEDPSSAFLNERHHLNPNSSNFSIDPLATALGLTVGKAEAARGRWFFVASVGFLLSTWAVFGGVSWIKLS